MLGILLVHPARLRRPVLHRLRHRRVARRLGAAHRRRHLHEDRRHRLRPHEDRLQDQGRRRAQPRRHRRLHRRQRRRLGRPHRPTASRPTASPASRSSPSSCSRSQDPTRAGPAPRLDLRHAHHDDHRHRASRYLINEAHRARRSYGNADKMNFEQPLTRARVADLDRLGRADLRRLVPAHRATSATARCGGSSRLIITCGTLAGAIIPELVKVFTSTESAPRARGRHRVARRRRVAQHPRPASPPATSAPTGWASSSSSSWASPYCVVDAWASADHD